MRGWCLGLLLGVTLVLIACGAAAPTHLSPTSLRSSTPVASSPVPGPSATPTRTPSPVPPTSTLRSSPIPPARSPTHTAIAPTLVPPTVTPVLPTVTPVPTPPEDLSIGVWESQLVLATAGWEQALVPTSEGDPVYPYPRMDFAELGPVTDRTYGVIVLENGYVRVTILPELGGRILRWEDKSTGLLLTYANPVIQPAEWWGYRGWLFVTGGLEWAFPTDEHGLIEYRPWQYELLSGPAWRGVRVWDTDDRTGLTVEVTLRLVAGRSDLFIAPRITNSTGSPQPFQFWINAMLTLSGGYAPTSGLRFWVPTEQMVVHSTDDVSLPGPGGTISWPVYAGRDLSWYREWHKYLGLFATSATGVVGAYDETMDQGLVRVYPAGVAPGVKIFCLGDLPSTIYTVDGSRYFELWGGYTRTFWEYAELAAGATVSWEERWYPVHGIGTLSWSNGELAAALQATEDGIAVGLYAPTAASAHLALRQNDVTVAEWDVAVGPGRPFRTLYPADGAGWNLQIWQDEALVVQVDL